MISPGSYGPVDSGVRFATLAFINVVKLLQNTANYIITRMHMQQSPSSLRERVDVREILYIIQYSIYIEDYTWQH